MRVAKFLLAIFSTLLLLAGVSICARAWADETCNFPYLTTLIHGKEDDLYVWTLGVPGMLDGSDKLVTRDVWPGAKSYGKVIAQVSVGECGEAHWRRVVLPDVVAVPSRYGRHMLAYAA